MAVSKESGIIPALISPEIDLYNLVSVSKVRISGGNEYGKPTCEIIEKKSINSFNDALCWCSQSAEYSYSFKIPLTGLMTTASLSDEESHSGQILTVCINNKTGKVPRSQENHHGVTTDL